MSDQFTRWLCPKCGGAGIDSWNKAMHDGIDYGGQYPNPAVFGDACQKCGWNVAICYTTADCAPTAIFAPTMNNYNYELEAMNRLEADPSSGETLQPSTTRDSDWSRGCVAAKGQLQ